MSLLLNALKKAESGEQPAEGNEAAAQAAAGADAAKPTLAPAPQVPPAAAPEASGGTVDFDEIPDEQSADAAGDDSAEASGGEQKSRIDAARVFGAGPKVEEDTGGGVLGKLLFTLVGLAVVGGGGYYVLISGLIPGVDLNSITSLFKEEEQVVQRAPAPSVDLQISDDIVLLPVPAVDVQSEVDFAVLRLPENSKNSVGEEEYIKQIAFLTGFDITKERERKIEEQRELLLDLEVSEQEASEVELLAEEEEGEQELESNPGETITWTADASREAKLALDSATPSDMEMEIVINGAGGKPMATETEQAAEVADAADATEAAPATEEAAPEATMQKVAQVEVKSSMEGRQRMQMLEQARALYAKGSYLEAETLYRNVLVSAPANRDALRGIAQIGVVTGRYQSAIATYLDLLNYYPNDPVAIAELTNLRGDSGNFYEIEKALKSTLGKAPAADGRLYFSLGNLYAQNSRMNEAQQAYFEAFSRETTNPDYAYNLAVVLDYLNKPSLAARYYQEALRLSKDVPVGFVRAEVEARLKDLN